MSTVRRAAVLAALTVAVTLSAIAATLPAWASWSDSASTGTTTYTTANVLAPTNVTGSVSCGYWNSTLRVSWTQSTTPQVSGYLVVVAYGDGTMQTYPTSASTTSWSKSVPTSSVTGYVAYSVMTQTSYGWTKQSDYTDWYGC